MLDTKKMAGDYNNYIIVNINMLLMTVVYPEKTRTHSIAIPGMICSTHLEVMLGFCLFVDYLFFKSFNNYHL